MLENQNCILIIRLPWQLVTTLLFLMSRQCIFQTSDRPEHDDPAHGGPHPGLRHGPDGHRREEEGAGDKVQ